MSVTTTVQPATESLSRHGSNISLSCHSSCGSVDDGLQGSHPQYQDTILTIEELRAQLNSCFTCGVSWSEEHVSLDCSECGGYSLQRPCPLCDGRCRTSWKRDLTMSHASGKARWIGECGLSCGPSIEEPLVPALEKLRATSWTVFNDECIERPLSYTVNNAQDLIHHHPYSITPTTIVRVENVWMWILDA